MVNYFSDQLEVGRAAHPPMTPYITTDTTGVCPRMPIGRAAHEGARTMAHRAEILQPLHG